MGGKVSVSMSSKVGLITDIRQELDAHQTHFLFLVFILTQFTKCGLHIVGFSLAEVIQDVLLMVNINKLLDEIIDVEVGA